MEIPQHISIIMDGNGRWAKKQGKMRLFGHSAGRESVRACTEYCAEKYAGWAASCGGRFDPS